GPPTPRDRVVRRALRRSGSRRAAGVGASLRDGAAPGAVAVVHRQLLAAHVDLPGGDPVRALPRATAGDGGEARGRATRDGRGSLRRHERETLPAPHVREPAAATGRVACVCPAAAPSPLGPPQRGPLREGG